MKVSQDIKAYVALVVISLGLTFTVLALATNHWYEIEQGQGVFPIKVRQYMGLWKICMSVYVMKASKSKCFKVTDSDGYKKYVASSFGVATRKRRDTDNPFEDLGKLFEGLDNMDEGNNSGMGENTEASGMHWETLDEMFGNNQGDDNNDGDMNADDNADNPFEGLGDLFNDKDNEDLDNLFNNNDDESLGDLGDLFNNDDDGHIKITEEDTFSDDLDDQLYPGYLKVIQFLESVAFLTGTTVVVLWILYLFMSVRGRGVRPVVYKTIVVVVTVLTAVLHLGSAFFWIVEKEREKSEYEEITVQGTTMYFGWSLGMVFTSAVLHLLSIVPVVLTKSTKMDDGMQHALTPPYTSFA